jgi:hypothetical protein
MMIRTKIVATVGPASADAKALEALVRAGVDVFRENGDANHFMVDEAGGGPVEGGHGTNAQNRGAGLS